MFHNFFTNNICIINLNVQLMYESVPLEKIFTYRAMEKN